ncbi:MAG: SRPBCC family protein [Hyphomicrobiales bacterium]
MTQSQLATIFVDRHFPHPPRQVWRALTDPELLAKWWAPGNIAPTVGHEFELDMGNWGMVPCRIIESRPGEFLSYTFGESWTLSWRLEAEGDGTRLYLEQSGLDLSKPNDRFAYDQMGAGWRGTVLPRLGDVLDVLGEGYAGSSLA